MIMAIAMVALLAFGGTYAFFTATTTPGSDTVTTAIIALDGNTVELTAENILPGESVLGEDDEIFVMNHSTRESYIFVQVTATVDAGTGTAAVDPATLVAAGWALVDGESNIYYKEVAKATDAQAGDKVAFTPAITFSANANIHDNDVDNAASDNAEVMGATVTVTFKAAAAQKLSTVALSFAEVEDAFA